MDTQRSLAAINELIEDFSFLKETLTLNEPSVSQNLMRHLTKMLVLSCASYYENSLTNSIRVYTIKHIQKYEFRPHGFDVMGKRSFFQMFDFGRERPNKPKAFLSPLDYFGREFRDTIVNEVVANEKLEMQMDSFQEICRLRNSMAHNDLITVDDAILNKSFSEIIIIHQNAVEFLDYLKAKIT